MGRQRSESLASSGRRPGGGLLLEGIPRVKTPAKVGPPVGLGRLLRLYCIYSWWLVVGAAAPLLGGLFETRTDGRRPSMSEGIVTKR